MMIDRFIRNKPIITGYYVTVLFIALLCWWWIGDVEKFDPSLVVILSIYILIFPIVIMYTRKYARHIFLFILALISGFYSFYHYSVGDHSVINALYFTFQLYLLNFTHVFTEDGTALLSYPAIVEIARWSAAASTISTLFIVMYRALEMSILLGFYQIVGNHYVVFGYNNDSVTLMKDLRKNKKRVILVSDNIPNDAVERLEDLKIVVIRSHKNEDHIYTKCGLSRAKNVVLFQEIDMDNLNEFIKIDYYLRGMLKKSSLSLFIHLKSETSRRLFMELEEERNVKKRPYTIHLIDVYDQFVDQLFTMYPVVKQHCTDEPMHVLIIGFGSMGQHVAQKVVTEGEAYDNRKVFITALDKHMKRLAPRWKQQYPEMAEKTSITLQTFDVMSDTIESLVLRKEVPITHIYICIHEDYIDVMAGIELTNIFPTVPIFIEFAKNSIAEKFIQLEISGPSHIYSTGTYEDVLTEEVLLRE